MKPGFVKIQNIFNVSWTPLRLVATAVSDVGIDLTWTNVDTKGDGVSIERSTDGITYAEIATVVLGVATYSNTGLTTGTLYYYRIRAYRGTQYSSYSNVTNTWASNTFKLELTTTVINQSVTLPHLAGYVYNYTVDYGDDSGIKTVTSYNDSNCTHTYVSVGAYTVKIVGTCETFNVNNGTLKLFVTKILSWGNVGLKGINFYSCTNLVSIAGDSSGLSLVTTFIDAFRGCSKLASIPSGIFDKCINVTSFLGIFYSCVLVTSIPSGLFDKNINVTIFDAAFYGCTGLLSVPTGLFRYNINVTNFSNCFYLCTSLTSIPTGLFDGNTLATNFTYTFRGCSKLASIPSGLFDKNINVTTFWGTFIICPSITSIPTGLFDNNTLVTDFSWTFFNTNLNSIPPGLFDHNPYVTSFRSVFSGTPSLPQPFTSIPPGLFDECIYVTGFSSVFEHCHSINAIPEHLFDNNVNVVDFSNVFYSDYEITSIPAELFKYNTKVTIFGNTTGGAFSRCHLVSIPEDLFKYNTLVTSFRQTFRDCNQLTAIPENLFAYNPLVTDFHNVFGYENNGCPLVTFIPTNLFANNLLVTIFDRAFYNATGLTGNTPDLWNRTNPTPTGASCFHGCSGLSNYASIPALWKA